MVSTTELTEKFVSEHTCIRDCLKNGLINYSALARFISKQPRFEKFSKEAIAIAALRLQTKLKAKSSEQAVVELFKKSNIEIKNNIASFFIEKNIFPDSLLEIETIIKKKHELFFAIEGKKTITVIIEKQNKDLIEKKLKNYIVGKKDSLSLISITSQDIDKTPGAVAYISSLFFDKGINIEEFMSCDTDLLITINTKDLNKIITELNF